MSYRGMVEIKQCAKCGVRIHLEVHHINCNHFDDTKGNHVVLCRHCHHQLHPGNWSLNDIGVEQTRITFNPSQTAYYRITTADIQRELDEMGDPITDILKNEEY